MSKPAATTATTTTTTTAAASKRRSQQQTQQRNVLAFMAISFAVVIIGCIFWGSELLFATAEYTLGSGSPATANNNNVATKQAGEDGAELKDLYQHKRVSYWDKKKYKFFSARRRHSNQYQHRHNNDDTQLHHETFQHNHDQVAGAAGSSSLASAATNDNDGVNNNNNHNHNHNNTLSAEEQQKRDAKTRPPHGDNFFRETPNQGGFTERCERVAGDEFLAREWKKSKREACRVNNSVGDGDTVVTEYLLAHLDAKPSLRIYENMFIESFAGKFLGTNCPSNTHLIDPRGSPQTPDWVKPLEKPRQQKKGGGSNKRKPLKKYGYKDHEEVLVREVRFHLGNPFEAFHAYINAYLMFRAFGFKQTKTRFVFEDKRESCLRDDEFWNSFSLNKQRPIYHYTGKDGLESTRIADDRDRPVLARRVVQGFSTGISVLVSNAAPLGGRGKEHPCSSSLLQNATRWMRRNFELIGRLPSPKPEISPRASKGKIEVIWNQRAVHPRAGGQLLVPHRMMARETQFVLALREALGPDVHLRVVDFSKLNGPESIRAAETAQVMIGFHGAGMTWGMFMKPSDSAIIEIFGANRPSSNKHYHSLSKLCDFNYRSFTQPSHFEPAYEGWPVEGEKKAVRWDRDTIKRIQSIFFSLPWSKSIRMRHPCF